jgi:hypothetical protein
VRALVGRQTWALHVKYCIKRAHSANVLDNALLEENEALLLGRLLGKKNLLLAPSTP